MRGSTFVGVTVGCVLFISTGFLPGTQPEGQPDRIAALIKQLGDEKSANRETASRELTEIGEPALPALRAAAAGADPEVRRRGERALQAIIDRSRAAAAVKELARWQGDWTASDGQSMTIKADRWTSSTPTFGPVSGPLKNIEVQEKMTLVDLVVEAGPTKGQTCKAIFRLDGGTLHYCTTYDATHPTEFKTVGNQLYLTWTRGKAKAAARLADPPPPPPMNVQYVGDIGAVKLPLAEVKEGVHRVVLECLLTDGGKGTLTLDPNGTRFNEFGDPVAGGKQLPLLRLECTLKLVKNEKGRQVYEVRGAKIVSRISLVAVPFDSPAGDGRLLVHDKGGEVRHVIGLTERTHRTVPCHPGCFPAGTAVRIPGGTKLIEQVRTGDLVTTIDADGKTSATKVTDVFVTRNRVLEVSIKGDKLVTTETQPIALEGGGYRPAGELKPGDRIWRWIDGARRATSVLGVTAADHEARVFNLVLGEPTGFIAGGFVVRSKPPAVP